MGVGGGCERARGAREGESGTRQPGATHRELRPVQLFSPEGICPLRLWGRARSEEKLSSAAELWEPASTKFPPV